MGQMMATSTKENFSQIYIFHIYSLKARKYKSSVVRSLVKRGELSVDRIVRGHQSEPISQDLNQSAADVRNLEDRDSFELFDNIAIESLSTSGKGYEVGKIVRMRRFITGKLNTSSQ